LWLALLSDLFAIVYAKIRKPFLIVPNLIPNDVPYEFSASLDAETNILSVMFLDKSTFCQTHSLQLKFPSRSSAYLFLTHTLGAIFEDKPSDLLTRGWASGKVVGPKSFTTIMYVGYETLLGDGIKTPWFTGNCKPFDTRTFPMVVWLAKNQIEPLPGRLSHAISKLLLEHESTLDRQTVDQLLAADYICDIDETFAAECVINCCAKSSIENADLAALNKVALQLLADQTADR
jgi:hypothetical protein